MAAASAEGKRRESADSAGEAGTSAGLHMSAETDPRYVQVGPCRMRWTCDDALALSEVTQSDQTPTLRPLRESQDVVSSDTLTLAEKGEVLRQRLREDGYLFLRSLISREAVLAARRVVFQVMSRRGDILDPTRDMEEGVLLSRCGLGCVPGLEGRNEISHHPAVLDVIQGKQLRGFFEQFLFQEEALTFDYKWLRVVPHQKFTGCHCDSIYMSRGTSNLYTTWIPFGDNPMEMGTVAVCDGSHKLPGFKKFQETYGSFDTEKEVGYEGSGWFCENPSEISGKFGGQWRSADFKAGDVLIFGMRTVHMSTCNTTQFARVSCDVRWQPASEAVDTRYMGEFGITKKGGLLSEGIQAAVTMADLKQKWGL